jgi:hypothetical protein
MGTSKMKSACRRALRAFVLEIAVLALVGVALASGQHARPARSKAKDVPLSAEQLAVYQVVLHDWIDDGKTTANLSTQTVPFPLSGAFDASACGKGLDLEPSAPGASHRFRTTDVVQLGSGTVALVDPLRQAKEVDANDPEKAIAKGMAIEDAVANGFAHGLVTVSEIRFDKGHKHALVSYSFRCGNLCGHGGAVQLEKVDGVWQHKSQCGDWIS